VLVSVLVAAGCGSGGDGTASPTPSTTASPTPTTTPTTGPTGSPTTPATTVVSVYFLKGEKLQPVARKALSAGVATEAVRWLLNGPTPGERAAGLTSTIPTGTVLHGVTVANGVATVDLSRRFESGGGTLSMSTRVAEVVFTLTRFPTVSKVSFALDGTPVTALGGEGIDLSKPVGRADYEEQSPAVLVESPRWGERVSSPLRVTGSANVFEAVFFLELRGPRGTVLANQRVMATSGTGTRGTFDVTLRPTIADPGEGTLHAYVRSPKDGSRQEVVIVPLVLTA
jgi:hypothetical protein